MVGISPSHLDVCSVSHDDVCKSEQVAQQGAIQHECEQSSSWKSEYDFGDFRPEPPRAPHEESRIIASDQSKNAELETSLSWKSAHDFGDFRPEPPPAPREESCVEDASKDMKDTHRELEASTSWNSAHDFGDFRPEPPRAPLEESCIIASDQCKSTELDASLSWNSDHEFGDFRPEPPPAPLEMSIKLTPSLENQQGKQSARNIDGIPKAAKGKTSVCASKLAVPIGAQLDGLDSKCDSERSSSWESAYGYGDFRPEPPPKAPIEDAEVLQEREDSISQACELERSSSWQSAYDFGDFRPEPPTAPLEDEHASIQKPCSQNLVANNELERSSSWHSACDFGDFRPEPSLAPPEELEQIGPTGKKDDVETYLTTVPLEVSQTLEQEPLEVSQGEEDGVGVAQDVLCDASLSRNSVFNVADSITDRTNSVDMPDASPREARVQKSLYEDSDEEDTSKQVEGAQTLEQATDAVASCEQNPSDNRTDLLTGQSVCANSTIMLSPTPLRITSSATAFLVQALQSPEKQKAPGNTNQSEMNRSTQRQCEDLKVASPCLQQSQSSTILFPRQRSASSRGPAVQADRVIADWDRLSSLLPGGMDVLARHKREALFARWDHEGLKVLSLEAIRNGMQELLGHLLTIEVISHAFEVAYRIAPKTVNFTSIEVLDLEGFRMFLVYITRFFEILRCLVEPETSGEIMVTFHDFHKTKVLFEAWGCPKAFETAIANSDQIFSEQRDRSVTFDVFAHWLIGICIELSAGEHGHKIQETQQELQDDCKNGAITSSGNSEDGSSALNKTHLNVPSLSTPSQTHRSLSKQSHRSRGSSRNSSASKSNLPSSRNSSRATSRIGSRTNPPSAPSQTHRAPSPNRLPNTSSPAGSRANSPSASSQTRAPSQNRRPNTPSSASRPPISTPVRNNVSHPPANFAPTARMASNGANVAHSSREQRARSQESQRRLNDIVPESLPQLRESASVVMQNARPHSAGQSRRSTIAARNVPRPRPGSARIPKPSCHERPVENACNSSRSSSLPPLSNQGERKKSVPAAMDREALRAHLRQHTECTRARLEAFQGSGSKNRYDRHRHDCAALGPVPGWRRL